jgi:uncharacterized membrane protein
VNFVPWLLFLHVLGAIVAFGSSFSAFPIIGAMAGREPMHANFAARVSEAIELRVTVPLAIVQAITGALLIVAAGINLSSSGWLIVGIILYAIALGYALFVQGPAARRMVELTSAAGSAAPAAGPAPAGPPPGPPPELLATAARLQRGGMLLGVLVLAIVFLMVVKPF